MLIIKAGDYRHIYPDTTEVSNKLENVVYKVCYSQETGFSLCIDKPLQKTVKAYGDYYYEDLKTVMRRWAQRNDPEHETYGKNLGLILVGEKGTGKSMFARDLCETLMTKGYPCIMINKYIPGITEFLKAIDQPVVLFFDEYDKTFGDIKVGDGQQAPQTALLSLMDGTSGGYPKLFLITANKENRLDENILGRPGRAHFLIKPEYPNSKNIKAYLKDKCPNVSDEIIEEVANFSVGQSISYDQLSAFAEELNDGVPFKQAVRYLNVIPPQYGGFDYMIQAYFSDGTVLTGHAEINFFIKNRNDKRTICLYTDNENNIADVTFKISDAVKNTTTGNYTIYYNNGGKLTWYINEDSAEDRSYIGLRDNAKLEKLEFKLCIDNTLKYAL